MPPVELVDVTVHPDYPKSDKHFPSQRILQLMFVMLLPTAKKYIQQSPQPGQRQNEK